MLIHYLRCSEAVKIVNSCACVYDAAKKLVRIAKLNDTHDNVTAVVVKISSPAVPGL